LAFPDAPWRPPAGQSAYGQIYKNLDRMTNPRQDALWQRGQARLARLDAGESLWKKTNCRSRPARCVAAIHLAQEMGALPGCSKRCRRNNKRIEG
jgi:hypothetical protein